MPVELRGIALGLSREMAIDYGIVQAMRAEQEKRDAELAEWRAKRAAEQPAYHAAIRRLDAVNDPLGRVVLDLHQRVASGSSWRCEGCDASGYDWEYPEWPCRTTEEVARHLGIEDVPNAWRVDRPADGSLDAPE